MARMSSSFFEEKNLPVEVRGETFTFGDVAYLTVGGFGSPDLVCLHLTVEQVEAIGKACMDYVRDYNAKAMVETVAKMESGKEAA